MKISNVHFPPWIRIIGVLFAFLCFGLGVVIGLWFLISSVLHFLSSLENVVAAAIITASITGFFSVLAVVYNQRRVKYREIREAHRPKKVEVYGLYMDIMFKTLNLVSEGHKVDTDPMPKEIVDLMAEFKRDLILWGSPSVIKAYLDWEGLSLDKKHSQSTFAWDRVLREFRKDLGNSNKLLKPGSLMQLILDADAQKSLLGISKNE